jgi:hypothetical protein
LTLENGMGKKSEYGMNNPDQISESLKTNFLVKIIKFFDAVPGSGICRYGMEKTSRIRKTA